MNNEQLGRTGEFVGRFVRAQDVIEHSLIGHVQGHLGAIREAIGA